MKIEDIFWHDSVIVRVVESPNEVLAFQVDYPEDWARGTYAKKTILFRDVLEYEIHEGPFAGRVTILDAAEQVGANHTRRFRLETNAGYREIRCKALELTDGHIYP